MPLSRASAFAHIFTYGTGIAPRQALTGSAIARCGNPMLVAIITNTIMFWRIERLAGLLFVPYAAWVTYATILNASLWLLNET
jgi:tryptophan-rich sensory protein